MQYILVLDEEKLLIPQTVTACSTSFSTVRYEHTLSAITKDSSCNILLDIHRHNNDRAERYQLLESIMPGATVFQLTTSGDIRALQVINDHRAPEEACMPPELLRYAMQMLEAATTAALASPAHNPYWKASPGMKEVYRLVSLVAPTDYQVMICGETGTGKEVIARMIHATSKRRDKPFIAVDCGCLNREMANSELFGHIKGAFTDAVCDKTGVFELADGGTLFLDEIGNLSYEVQVSLLRSLQEKMIRKTGATKELAVDVRVLAATNEHLEENIQAGTFRADLYYRLNEVSLQLPPLRERRDDILPLAHHLLTAIAGSLGKQIKGFCREVETSLCSYSWPGNIRELKNVLKRCCLLTPSGRCIELHTLPESMQPEPAVVSQATDSPADLKRAASQAEYERIVKALEMAQFNKRKAADLLQVHRKTLYNKLKEMNIG